MAAINPWLYGDIFTVAKVANFFESDNTRRYVGVWSEMSRFNSLFFYKVGGGWAWFFSFFYESLTPAGRYDYEKHRAVARAPRPRGMGARSPHRGAGGGAPGKIMPSRVGHSNAMRAGKTRAICGDRETRLNGGRKSKAVAERKKTALPPKGASMARAVPCRPQEPDKGKPAERAVGRTAVSAPKLYPKAATANACSSA